MHNSSSTKKKLLISSVVFTFLSLNAIPAYAYLDPGTGSLIIQSIIGAVAAVGVTMKLYWHKIKLLFSGKQNSESKEDTPS